MSVVVKFAAIFVGPVLLTIGAMAFFNSVWQNVLNLKYLTLVAASSDVIRRWRRVVCACAEATMTSSSNYDIRRNLIDAPSCDSQLPAVGGSDLALGGPGADDRRTPLRGCVLRGMPHAMSQDSLSVKYHRFVGFVDRFLSTSGTRTSQHPQECKNTRRHFLCLLTFWPRNKWLFGTRGGTFLRQV